MVLGIEKREEIEAFTDIRMECMVPDHGITGTNRPNAPMSPEILTIVTKVLPDPFNPGVLKESAVEGNYDCFLLRVRPVKWIFCVRFQMGDAKCGVRGVCDPEAGNMTGSGFKVAREFKSFVFCEGVICASQE
jgi:hypothetical protein